MRSTIIAKEQGYLGAFPQILEPGDTQALVFASSDTGPFWISSEDWEQSRLDTHNSELLQQSTR